MILTDLLVIGSGISGLTYAIKTAEKNPHASVTIVTKESIHHGNTRWAQGGVAIVTDFEKDSLDRHINDTIEAGDGVCDEKVVRFVVEQGIDRLNDLLAWGAQFDRDQDGNFNLGKEGGHSNFRIIHHKDITGFEIQRTLVEKIKTFSNIRILEDHLAIDLITDHHIKPSRKAENLFCYGAYIYSKETKSISTISSKITVLATGGAGQVYQYTTNPSGATGDGIGLAYRAKARIKNMQYVQFHPTALFGDVESDRAFLISEAVRGAGAKLMVKDGQSFLNKYDDREELASRDIVARAIDNELKIRGQDYVLLDCTHMDQEEFIRHFPNIYDKCLSIGINPLEKKIPVVPAAHYHCGGIEIDKFGQTSINHLFAIGECACSGLHGANRLASNSLLEGLVFGHRACTKSSELLDTKSFGTNIYQEIPDWNDEGMHLPDEMVLVRYLKNELKFMMSDLVGIVRTDNRLKLARQKENEIYLSIKELYDISILSPQLLELRNLTSVAHLIIDQSIEQTENRGAFYNRDLV